MKNPQPSSNSHPGLARRAALEAFARVPRQATATVPFSSSGSLLVIGDATHAYNVVDRINGQLDCTVLIAGPHGDQARCEPKNGIPRLSGTPVAVHGYLGHFNVELSEADGRLDTNAATGGWRDHFDLVLDLGTPPVDRSELHPLGYFAPGQDAAALDEVLKVLPSLSGDFDKPQYFSYDASICAHGRSGIRACTRCLDTCPTNAISSIGDSIKVDAHLCQGAGSCATACPTGAIRYNYPCVSDTLAGLREALKAFRSAGGTNPIVLFYGSEHERDLIKQMLDRLPDQVIPIEVEETGSVGMEVWLSTLAYGASAVHLLLSSKNPHSVVNEIRNQLSYTHALLQGMDHSPECISIIHTDFENEILNTVTKLNSGISIPPAEFAPLNQKRRTIQRAVEHLYTHAIRSRPMITLPAGAPFGEIWVDVNRCTLCMACVSQCPAGALEAGGDIPMLRFIEDNCVQCALCARSCPENAITPSPRYLFPKAKRQQRRILKEDKPFFCTSCGKPFGTQSMVTMMSRKLQSHPLFHGTGANRLKMCEDCRAKDMLREQLNQVTDSNPV